MNKNFRKFMIAGIVLVALIFVLPFIWPVNAEWYFSNLNWLIPLVIILFIVPIVPFILSNWDIHFSFQSRDGNLIVTMSNTGTTPFGFNRIQFASAKKYRIFGKRKFHPESGIYDVNVEFHGNETPSSILHEHIGCTLRKGLPITLTIRNNKAPENISNFKKKGGGTDKVYLSLYYEGTNQRVYSQPIPPKIITEIIQNYKQD